MSDGDSPLAPPACPSCSRPPGAGAVRLWNGREYCAACVERASPRLLAYARAHSTLEEKFPLGRWVLWRRVLGLYGLVGLLFFGLFLVIGANQDAGKETTLTYYDGAPLAVLLLGGFIFLIQGLPLIWAIRGYLPRVAVQDGLVTFVFPGLLRSHVVRQPLPELRWHPGRLCTDVFNHRAFLVTDREALILVRPKESRWLVGLTRKVPVGGTPELREVWTAFLGLAGVPLEMKSGSSPPASPLAH